MGGNGSADRPSRAASQAGDSDEAAAWEAVTVADDEEDGWGNWGDDEEVAPDDDAPARTVTGRWADQHHAADDEAAAWEQGWDGETDDGWQVPNPENPDHQGWDSGWTAKMGRREKKRRAAAKHQGCRTIRPRKHT